jgi:microcystin-dependent protein
MKRLLLILALLVPNVTQAALVPASWIRDTTNLKLYNPYFSDSVGIGTTSPYAKLSIETGAAINTGIVIKDFSSQAAPALKYWRSDNVPLAELKRYSGSLGGGGTLSLYNNLGNETRLFGNGALYIEVPGQTAAFRLLPFANDIYFQNTVSTGNVNFTGLNGANLTGAITFQSTGQLNFGPSATARMTVLSEAAGGYVGFSTTSPTAQLTMQSASAAQTAWIARFASSTGLTTTGIDNKGNLRTSVIKGIGYNSNMTRTDSKFEVQDENGVVLFDFRNDNQLRVQGSSGSAFSYRADFYSGIGFWGGAIGRNEANSTSLIPHSGDFELNTRLNTNKGLVIKGVASQSGNLFEAQNSAGTVIDVIDASGNIGIGTSTPYAKLSVVGEAVAQNFTATSSSATTTLTNLKTTGQVDGIPPAGTMMMWAGASTTVPSGYLYADGRAVSRTTYAGLFTAIGTLWGSGDGSTTFNIPDARRRYPRGENTTEYRVGTTSSADAEGHDLNGILSAPQVEVDSNLDGSTSFVTSSVTFTSNLEVHGVVPTFVVGYIIKY